MPQRRDFSDDGIYFGQNLMSDDDSVFDIILDLESGKVSTTDDLARGKDSFDDGAAGEDAGGDVIALSGDGDRAGKAGNTDRTGNADKAGNADNAGGRPDISGKSDDEVVKAIIESGEKEQLAAAGAAADRLDGGDGAPESDKIQPEISVQPEIAVQPENVIQPENETVPENDTLPEVLPDSADVPDGEDALPDLDDDDGTLFDDNVTEESEAVPDKAAPGKAMPGKAATDKTASGEPASGEPDDNSGVQAAVIAASDDGLDYGGMYIIGNDGPIGKSAGDGIDGSAKDTPTEPAKDDVGESARYASGQPSKANETAANEAAARPRTPEEIKAEEDSLALKALIGAAEAQNEPAANDVKTSKLAELATEMDETREESGSGEKLRNILGLSMPDSNGTRTIGGITHGMWAIIILLVFLADVILLNFVVYKLVYPAVSAVMTETGAASLKLDSYETLYTGISYGIAFLAGGLIVFLISKIAQILMEEVGTENPGTVIKAALLVAVAVFAVGGIIAMLITRQGLFTVAIYRWISPMAAYAGGVLFFAVSGIGGRKSDKG
ncbi:MAG: hypothetical protein ILO53_01405 [Clostridia bacterium]|nr:hypothetical protein [Clostridia bacterium]